jgi:RNA polymerase sigma-70 factor, ECF subfamily
MRMDWKEQADATELRLRQQFVQALAGDGAAYRLFLKALAPHLRAYFRKRLAQLPDDVEDLVQETMLAIHSHRHTYKLEQPLMAWVHTIARYKLVDLLRARSRREALNDPIDDEQALFVESHAQAADARRDVNQLLATLPERQRRALRMTKLEGASVAETAAQLGISEVSVKVGVHRSLKALAARVKGSA